MQTKNTRKAYTAPVLTVHGSVEELTLGVWGKRDDFFTGNSDSGLTNCNQTNTCLPDLIGSRSSS